ncbi:MAG: ftsL [Gammaproteobacteria bacterium]|jgi:cell division protein FtsL|nr:ftsL [Gammaproteobacteria bacterium]
MNSTARALAQASFSKEEGWSHLLSRRLLLGLILTGIVSLSAFGVVYIKDSNRRTFIEVQQLEQERDHLHVEWGQLLLEESSFSTARIQDLAQQKLGMQVPAVRQIMMVNNTQSSLLLGEAASRRAKGVYS